MSLAAAISIAAAAFPVAGAADQTSCQPGAGPVGGDPSKAGGVNIHVTANNSVIWCPAHVLEANSDVPDGTNYPVRATTESPNDNPVSHAISVRALLTLAGLNPASVNHTEIMRLDSGTWSQLENADLADPSTFVDGLKPIFWINGSETDYLRPLRGPSDTNGNDLIVASNGSALDSYVYSGPVLTVTGTATPTHVAVNQPVTFTAKVTNQTGAEGTLIYTWDFRDTPTTATGSLVKHSYTAAGNWYPVVTVHGEGNDSGGASQPIPVTVGSLPNGSNPGRPSGANPNKHAHAGGPTHSHGTTPNAAPAHKHSGGAGANRTSGNNQTHTPTTPATSTTTSPAATTTSPAATTTSPAATTTTSAAKTNHTTVKRRPGASPNRVPPQSTPGGTVVKGLLVADVIPVSAAQLAQQNAGAGQSSQAYAPSAALGGGSVTPIAGIAGGCVVMLLLASGAGRELRSQRRRVTPTRHA